MQVVVDVFCSLAFAKLYTSKMPITAANLLYDRVLPFYQTLGIEIDAVLTHNGREFCGRPEPHHYKLLLAMEAIEHRTTNARSPRTNGFVEHESHPARRVLPDRRSKHLVRVRRPAPGRPRPRSRALQPAPFPPGLPARRQDAGPSFRGGHRCDRRPAHRLAHHLEGGPAADRRVTAARMTECRINTQVEHTYHSDSRPSTPLAP